MTSLYIVNSGVDLDLQIKQRNGAVDKNQHKRLTKLAKYLYFATGNILSIHAFLINLVMINKKNFGSRLFQHP